MQKEFKNILVVSGTGRNVGKTTFVCRLIEKFRNNQIIGLKISPHFHDLDKNQEVIVKTEKFEIIKENNLNGLKDSSKMLISGAQKVYYIQSDEENLSSAFDYFSTHLMENKIVICESAAISKFIKPAYHFKITNSPNITKKENASDIVFDYLIVNDGSSFDFPFENLYLTDNIWTFI